MKRSGVGCGNLLTSSIMGVLALEHPQHQFCHGVLELRMLFLHRSWRSLVYLLSGQLMLPQKASFVARPC